MIDSDAMTPGTGRTTDVSESHRATLTVRNAEGGWATLIVAHRGTGRQSMVWLSFGSTTTVTAVLGQEQVSQLIEAIRTAAQGLPQ